MYGFYTLKFQDLDFLLKFVNIWILHPKIKFWGVNSKYPQMLGGETQILKFQDVKSNHPQTLGV